MNLWYVMKTIEIYTCEYNSLIIKIKMFKNQELLLKINFLLYLLYEIKYGLCLCNYTFDLTEIAISEMNELLSFFYINGVLNDKHNFYK